MIDPTTLPQWRAAFFPGTAALAVDFSVLQPDRAMVNGIETV
ncbi:hypothetical protein [Sphingomonas sp. Leaf17]|nr:hypothetical protein [Sphingomonas sp. Leaf17]